MSSHGGNGSNHPDHDDGNDAHTNSLPTGDTTNGTVTASSNATAPHPSHRAFNIPPLGPTNPPQNQYYAWYQSSTPHSVTFRPTRNAAAHGRMEVRSGVLTDVPQSQIVEMHGSGVSGPPRGIVGFGGQPGGGGQNPSGSGGRGAQNGSEKQPNDTESPNNDIGPTTQSPSNRDQAPIQLSKLSSADLMSELSRRINRSSTRALRPMLDHIYFDFLISLLERLQGESLMPKT